MHVTFHISRRPVITVLMLVALGVALVGPLATQQQIVQAAPFEEVKSLEDSGADSLRQAIANVDAGGTITFEDGLTGTITLTSELVINKDMTITGPGADVITVSGNNAVRVFSIGSGTTVEIRGLTISNGSDINGGGIETGGNLTISNSIVTNNGATLAGGGIYNVGGTLTLTNSTISGNTSADLGGGIYNAHELVVINSIIKENEATFRGGGIYSDEDLELTDSTIADNEATHGGGIYGRGTLSIVRSTIANNTASDTGSSGGGIYSLVDMLSIVNSTISGNSSALAGGGIINGGPLSIINSTIIDNEAPIGAGIFDPSGPSLTATIVANNTGGAGNCVSAVTGDYNLSDDESCFAAGGTNIVAANPLLGPLEDNGGPTETHALLDGSPAIDAFPTAACTTALDAPVTDQRGVARPTGDMCDIGAFEVGEILPPTLDLPEPITVTATGMDGALVDFEVSATDWEGTPLDVTCDASSGTSFPIATTIVECSATDSWEQTTTDTFTITVLGSDDLLAALIQDVRGSRIPAYLKPRLLAFLNVADLALDRGNTTAACVSLQTFSEQVAALSPRLIDPALVSEFRDDAQAIRESLGCQGM